MSKDEFTGRLKLCNDVSRRHRATPTQGLFEDLAIVWLSANSKTKPEG